MGVFDDAIREHLELKRHAGADEDELKELEDEAFGPPARPGEPDFPSSTSEEAAVEEEGDSPSGIFDAESGSADASEAGTVVHDEPEVASLETPEDAVLDEPDSDEPALTPLDEAISPGTDEAPAAPADDTGFDDEGDAAEALDPGEASTFTTAEREAIADQPTVFFDQQDPADFELGELELDLDEEIEEVGGSVSEPLADEEPLIVEEAFAEPSAETEVAEPPHEVEPEPEPEPPLEPEPEPAPEPEPGEAEPPDTSDFAQPAETAEPEAATGDDDVLEETPEFLRDNPDDDELWFEQGEPKDFDF